MADVNEERHLQTRSHSTKREASLQSCRMCPERPYIQLQVPENAKSIQGVNFTIISHDQGWADQGHPDPYANSYTWFGVRLKRKALRFNAVSHQLEIQRNFRGSDVYRTHRVSWDTNGVNGSWVRSIKKGDVVEFLVRAEYPAWVNIVKSVEVEILYDPETEASDTINNTTIRDATSCFEYAELHSAREIRLILIHPGSFDDPLNCTLIHANLESAELSGYETKSYFWGDSSTQATINLEYGEKTSELGVSSSVENILRYMRRNDGQIRKLWVDAICIDQRNHQERAQQVSLMADVYSKADTVNIWLGTLDHITQLAFRVIRDIYNYQKKYCPGGITCTCLGTAHTMVQKDFLTLDNFSNIHEKMDAITQFHLHREPDQMQDRLRDIMVSHYPLISELFRNPWFQRVWVLQEVINSKHAILHCGMDSIPWNELIEVNEYRDHYVPHLEPLYRLPQIWMHLGRLRNPDVFPLVRGTGEEKLERARGPGILDVVLEALELDATDPRDKIFALLSFGEETHDIWHLPELIKPDYTKSVEKVFTDFTRWWINEHKSLRILSMIHGNLGRTWQGLHCPFVESPATVKPTWMLRTEGMHSWAIATLDSQFEFCAAGDSVPIIETIPNGFDSDPLHLRLLGYEVAKIVELSHFPLQERLVAENDSLFEVYQRIFEPVESQGRWKSLRKQENEPPNRQEVTRMISEHLRAHWQYEAKEPLSLLTLNLVRDGHGSDYERIDSHAALPCNGPCFFVASDGSIGLCPAGARVGDWIAILLGGKVPFLLRESHADEGDRQFELIGECYVDGKMHGEFIRDQESKGLNPKYLVLI